MTYDPRTGALKASTNQSGKFCTKCGVFHALEGFSPNKYTRDGHSSQCKECCKAYALGHSHKLQPAHYEEKHALNLSPTKTCSKCHETKPTQEFSKMLRTSDGYRPNCRTCQKEDNRVKYLKRKQEQLT